MNQETFLALSNEEVLSEIKSLLYLFSHQEIIRHGLNRKDEEFKTQSVSEHIYNMITLCEYFLPLEDPESNLDKAKITQMILWHDIEEIETGDIPKHLKTTQHETEASSAFDKVLQKVPISLRETIAGVYEEYEERQTLESQFVKALDATEANMEDFTELGKKRLLEKLGVSKEDLQLFYKLGDKATKNFPCMNRIIELRYKNEGNCPNL